MTDADAPRCGVYFIATGAPYLAAAARAAQSVKATNPGLEVAVATDLVTSPDAGIFDHVVEVARPHRRSKVDMMPRSPFDRTIFLDTDTRVVADVSEVFALLDRFDLALAHAHSRKKRGTTQTWQTDLPDAFPQCNSGVIAYRKSPETTAFFEAWAEDFAAADMPKDQVTLRELLWQTDLHFFILPPEYNLRHTRYAHFWKAREAVPKILHRAAYNQTDAPAGKWVAARLKEVAQDVQSGAAVVGIALFKLLTFWTRRY